MSNSNLLWYWQQQQNADPLPKEYRRVEYLEAATLQPYITAVSGDVDNTYGMEAVLSCNYNGDNYPAGFSTTNNKRFLFWGVFNNNVWCYGWHDKGTTATQPNITQDKKTWILIFTCHS